MYYSLQQINEFRFKKINVLNSNNVSSESEIYNLIDLYIGLHSARIGKPYISLLNKGAEYDINSLYNIISNDLNYGAIRGIRQTLHICNLENMELLHFATKLIRIPNKIRRINNSTILKSEYIILNEYEKRDCMTSNHCYQLLMNHCCNSIEDAKLIFKYHWENGLLAMRNDSKNVFKENRLFYLSKKIYNIDLTTPKLDEQIYLNRLVFKYIKTFGPVSVGDIIWWTGLNKTKINKAINTLISYIEIINVRELNLELIVLKEDLELLDKFKTGDQWCKFMSYEDSAMKAFYETRSLYTKNAAKYFNKIGEIYATIVLNGQCVGIWNYDTKKKNIYMDLYKEDCPMSVINAEKNRMEKLLFPCE